jgi:hypothetical protein
MLQFLKVGWLRRTGSAIIKGRNVQVLCLLLIFLKKTLRIARSDVDLALKDALKLRDLSLKVKDYLFSTLA